MQNLKSDIRYSMFDIHGSFRILLSFLLLPTVLFAQISAGPDVTINPGVPVTLTATYGLIAQPVIYTQSGDDWVEGPYPIGFNFTFFGEMYTEFFVGANGFISFSDRDVTANFRDAFIIPCGTGSDDTYKPKICIFGSFCDINPTGVGSPYIYYKTIGTEPNRKLVVMWCQAPMNWCTDAVVTFQVILKESVNVIENHILQKSECFLSNNNKATLGLQNAYENLGKSPPARNASSWTVIPNQSEEAWRYETQGQNDYYITSVQFSLEPLTPGDKIIYSWYEGTSNVPFSMEPSVVVSPVQTTTYRVVATICSGEEFTDEVTVTVSGSIPNAFTPNGEEPNNTFEIKGLPVESITMYHIQIYNRWGQLVFSETDISKPWNGQMNNTGEACPDGVYVWVIYYELDGTRVTNKGTVTLLR